MSVLSLTSHQMTLTLLSFLGLSQAPVRCDRLHSQSWSVYASLNMISISFHLGDSWQYNKKHCHFAVVNFMNLFYCLIFKGIRMCYDITTCRKLILSIFWVRVLLWVWLLLVYSIKIHWIIHLSKSVNFIFYLSKSMKISVSLNFTTQQWLFTLF